MNGPDLAVAIAPWLRRTLGADDLVVDDVRRRTEGFSWQTYTMTARWRAPDGATVRRGVVVRRQSEDGLLAPYDIVAQCRLHEHLLLALGRERAGRVGGRTRERVAAVIHLCGPARAAAFVRRGFRAAPGELCGAHDLGAYLARVDRATLAFERLARGA